MKGLRQNTPIEEYKINGKKVLVKRDDLMGDNQHFPPWGKLLGIKSLIDKLDPAKPIVQLNVYGSWSGWALSRLAPDHEVFVVHPKTKKITGDYLDRITAAHGRLIPIRANMMRVLYSQAKNYAEDHGYQMLPYAFDNEIYVGTMQRRFLRALNNLPRVDTFVVSSGSGVTLSGLAQAFFQHNPKGKVYSVCVSSEASINRMTKRYDLGEAAIHVVKSEYAFDDTMPHVSVPFPCNQFWDKKAWHWLTENPEVIQGRTLFWNLGGLYTF